MLSVEPAGCTYQELAQWLSKRVANSRDTHLHVSFLIVHNMVSWDSPFTYSSHLLVTFLGLYLAGLRRIVDSLPLEAL